NSVSIALNCQPGSWQFKAMETLLKGKEIPLQPGVSFSDKDGNLRRHIRVRWWDRAATTYRSAFMGPESARSHIPDDDIAGDHLVEYAYDAPPVFLGHYWMEGDPEPLADNIACLDYSVAKPGGKLVAYRWNGERRLLRQSFVSVARREGC
ncbi:MAG TPA: metallophosphoesterase, partial [Gammaproteobacteria bacterium]|nr:metallophosphoesterase [Gammaproteobacteria bacterium]